VSFFVFFFFFCLFFIKRDWDWADTPYVHVDMHIQHWLFFLFFFFFRMQKLMNFFLIISPISLVRLTFPKYRTNTF
jgi:hypothetical protein